jgi:hypothetical protein
MHISDSTAILCDAVYLKALVQSIFRSGAQDSGYKEELRPRRV